MAHPTGKSGFRGNRIYGWLRQAHQSKRVQRCYQHEQHHEALDTLTREGTRCAARDGAREAECSVNGE